MTSTDITVLALSVLAIAGLGCFFFAPRKGRTAELAGDDRK